MLPTLFREIGLEQVGADGEVIDGGDTMRSLFRVNVEQAAEQLIQQQVVEPHELSAFIDQLDSGLFAPLPAAGLRVGSPSRERTLSLLGSGA
jgi:hypothetical protein